MLRRLTTALCLLLAGCSAYHPPTVDAPSAWQAPSTAPTTAAVSLPDPNWWTRFGSDELNRLIVEAKAKNYDINIAATRILQSEANLRSSQASLVPQISGSGGVSSTSGFENYSTSLSASYQLDVFGRLRNNVAGSKVGLETTRYNREVTEITIVSQVINQYLQLLSVRERLTLTLARLKNAEDIMQLVETQRRVGTISDLEIAGQRRDLAGQRAGILQLRTQERNALNALAVLLGRMPEDFDVKGQALTEIALPEVAAGIPSTVLTRRPSLRIAEANLRAAHFSVNAAIAARFPVINLTASGGASSPELTSSLLTDLLSSPISLGARLSQTIFSGGSLAAAQKSQEANYKIVADTYQKEVLTAYREVEDALTAVENLGIQAGFTQEASTQADEAYRLATLRYRAGIVDFQTVLNAQSSSFSQLESLVNNKLSRFTAVVTLVQALGGGWEGELRNDRTPIQEAKQTSDSPS